MYLTMRFGRPLYAFKYKLPSSRYVFLLSSILKSVFLYMSSVTSFWHTSNYADQYWFTYSCKTVALLRVEYIKYAA